MDYIWTDLSLDHWRKLKEINSNIPYNAQVKPISPAILNYILINIGEDDLIKFEEDLKSQFLNTDIFECTKSKTINVKENFEKNKKEKNRKKLKYMKIHLLI